MERRLDWNCTKVQASHSGGPFLFFLLIEGAAAAIGALWETVRPLTRQEGDGGE